VDYILQRLGFSHAKTTIPKWLQVQKGPVAGSVSVESIGFLWEKRKK
jgi:hypothetical protein